MMGNANGGKPSAQEMIYRFLMEGGYVDPRTGVGMGGFKPPSSMQMGAAPPEMPQGGMAVPRRPRGGLMGLNHRLGR